MATAKMAMSSGESASFLSSIQKAVATIYHTLTLFNDVSDDTLNVLVGLCAGRGALLRIERKQTLKLFKRLSASETHISILDDETWAAEVGGSVVGEVEGHRSYLKPWAEPNFGVKFLYRRAAEESVSHPTQDPKYSIYPHDGTLYGALLKSEMPRPSPHTKIGTQNAPNGVAPLITTMNSSPRPVAISPKLLRTPLLTPFSNSTSKKISSLLPANKSARRSSLITPPASPTPCRLSTACATILDDQNTLPTQILTKRPKVSYGSPGLLTILFSQEDEWTSNRRARGKGARLNQPVLENLAKELERGAQKKALGGGQHRIPELPSKEYNCEDSDDNMSFTEVKQLRLQQSRRLQKAPYLQLEFQKPGEEIR
jgi:hypothetical protein